MTIFTLGYQKRDLDEFIDILNKAGVDVVIDVRDTPWSRKKGFSKNDLSNALLEAGIDYIHAQFAGNPKSIRHSAETPEQALAAYEHFLEQHPHILDEFDALLDRMANEKRHPCLMCYERHPGDCHRSILLDLWQQHSTSSVPIEHLATDGLPRLIQTNLFDE